MGHKTYDGKPLCMGVSGFTHYNTERSDADQYPPVALGPKDLLKQIDELRNILTNPDLLEAINAIRTHIADHNNPHKTTLDQLIGDIGHAIYNEFIERTQSALTYEEFEKALFELIHIANDQEIKEGKSTSAVLSVYGARRYIDLHDADENAHHELFEKIVPGSPIIEDPTYAWYPQFGFSEYLMEPQEIMLSDEDREHIEEIPYTYIGVDGYLYKADKDILPVDYAFGTPMVPCFGVRRNSYIDSTSIAPFTAVGTSFLPEAEEAPDKSITATAIYQAEDTEQIERGLTYKNFVLERKSPMTVSVFVKPEAQTIFKIAWEDTLNSGIDTYAVFDLQNNRSVIVNHLNRYACTMQKLGNGWYRCGLSMYHADGRIADLRMSFADAQSLDNVEDWVWATTSTGALCGYVWGVQFEDGFQMSPYIPTAGKLGIRKAINLHIRLQDTWFTPYSHTYHIDYWNAITDPSLDEKAERPVCLIKNNEFKSLYIRHTPDSIRLTRYFTYTTNNISYDIGTLQDETFIPDINMLQVTTAIDTSTMVTVVNDKSSIKSHSVPFNTATDIYLGTDTEGNYYNGYVADLSIYPIRVTETEAQFLNGEDYE